jgi:uncharacterized protein (TIGR03083 family)
VEHQECCDLLEVEISRFAAAADGVAGSAVVPSCPEWTVADLTTHLGTIHRWAEHLVRVRAATPVPSSSVGADGALPTGDWIRTGGGALVGTLRAADPDDPMWAWGVDQHVRFWSRRQLHETLVHRVDAELAAGTVGAIEPVVAADGIDELLTNLGAAAAFSPNVAELRGTGSVSVRSLDTGDEWTITLSDSGFSVARRAAGTDAASLAGEAASLLLVLYRRYPAGAVTVTGELATFWLEHSGLG